MFAALTKLEAASPFDPFCKSHLAANLNASPASLAEFVGKLEIFFVLKKSLFQLKNKETLIEWSLLY